MIEGDAGMSETEPGRASGASACAVISSHREGVGLFGGRGRYRNCRIVTASVLGRWLFSTPIPGDFELAQIGTAIAVFAFLPYCQIVRGNIVVDTFTSRLPARFRGRMDALWDGVYAAAMALVAACLIRGTLRYLCIA